MALLTPVRAVETTQVASFKVEYTSATQRTSVQQQIPLKYLNEAIDRCELERLDDGSYYAEIPGFEGVWANDPSPGRVIAELREVLFDWLTLKIEDADRDIPVLAGIDLNGQH